MNGKGYVSAFKINFKVRYEITNSNAQDNFLARLDVSCDFMKH